MPPTPRLYVDAALAEGAILSLEDAQAHYLIHVMRRAAGDPLRLFNDRDGEFDAVIDSVGRKAVAARIGRMLRRAGEEPSSGLWLLFAPVKRDAVDLIVQKATELGASLGYRYRSRMRASPCGASSASSRRSSGASAPVATERTNAARINPDRLRAIATEAAEQSGRLSVPEFADLAPLDEILAAWPSGRWLLYCDEAGDDPAREGEADDERTQRGDEGAENAVHRTPPFRTRTCIRNARPGASVPDRRVRPANR